jgi:hypothetical protein
MADDQNARQRALARLKVSRRDIVQAIQEMNEPAPRDDEQTHERPGWSRWLNLAHNLVQHAPWWPWVSRLAEHALAGSPASVGLLLASRTVVAPARRAVRQHPWLLMGAAVAAGALVFGQRRRLWRLGLAFALPRVVSKAREVGHMLATEALTHWFSRERGAEPAVPTVQPVPPAAKA